MKPADRNRLTVSLREQVARIAKDLRDRMREPGPTRERAQTLHRQEQVGEDFEVWTDLLSRRSAVLWVLKSVYVRVLEDRGLLAPGRILDQEAEQLFERLAPNLGPTSFLCWVYRDLASRQGGLPELFSPQPAEVAWPADELSRQLIAFWRHRDPDTGAQWSFAEEHFEGELMGDLYQELDPVVKERFALCQTPEFVREFILDRTLSPAIETFGAESVRLLDPACGSGHFLIDGLKRLVAATGEQHPDWEREELVCHCLKRVVGIDLNDYACSLARARLVMTAAELAGMTCLAEAGHFHPHVYWADGLEQVERDEPEATEQLDLFEGRGHEAPRGSLTRPEVRLALRKVLGPKFQAVVGNPPYITEKDPARKEYHREKVGKAQRYVSAYREYSLASPFTERCLQLATLEGYVGLITSNNFMKREFGKALIEKVLASFDLTLVVDTSQVPLPAHGTSTVMLFLRNRMPTRNQIQAVMGKRGETRKLMDVGQGRVWLSIANSWDHVGFENDYVSVADLPREAMQRHPWPLRGGGATELKQTFDNAAQCTLTDVIDEIGRTTHTGEDEVFVLPISSAQTRGLSEACVPIVLGEAVRDWLCNSGFCVIFPYDTNGEPKELLSGCLASHFWRYRTRLKSRIDFGKTIEARGLRWFDHSMFFASRFRISYSLSFAEVTTHNHFAFDRGGKVFNKSAPAIKLSPTSTEDDYLALLGLLNSSIACFWMKQVSHCKGAQGVGEGAKTELWEQFYAFDTTKLKRFPIPHQAQRLLPYSRKLDQLANQRNQASLAALHGNSQAWYQAADLRAALDARRESDLRALCLMIALQEELDWLCYGLYGLTEEALAVDPQEVPPTLPTWLPWVLNLAQTDAQIVEALARGEEPDENPTAWFQRHRWAPLSDLPDVVPTEVAARIRKRQEIIKAKPEIALIETSTYKRRWYRPDYPDEEKVALQSYLTDALEAAARGRNKAFNLEQLCAALQSDPRVLAVAEVLEGRPDFHLPQLVLRVLDRESVPTHPTHLYKPSGLVKRLAWEKTWEEQRRQDAGLPASPEVPPSYISADFLHSEHWQLRGKLDVPKERFLAFTEVPGREDADTLYGWAGWTPLQRLKVLLNVDEDLDDAGVPLADRAGLLDTAWRLLPWVVQEDPQAAGRLRAELQAVVGAEGPSREMLEDWRKRNPPPKKRKTRN